MTADKGGCAIYTAAGRAVRLTTLDSHTVKQTQTRTGVIMQTNVPHPLRAHQQPVPIPPDDPPVGPPDVEPDHPIPVPPDQPVPPPDVPPVPEPVPVDDPQPDLPEHIIT